MIGIDFRVHLMFSWVWRKVYLKGVNERNELKSKSRMGDKYRADNKTYQYGL